MAFQIAATRDKRGWTQARLASETNMSQNNISRLENPEYGKHTISSLKRIAEALDVALVVRLVPFSQYIEWVSGTPNLDKGISPEALAVPSFEDEERAGTFEASVRYFPVIYPATPQVSNGRETAPSVPRQGEGPFSIQKVQSVPTREYILTAATPESTLVERVG